MAVVLPSHRAHAEVHADLATALADIESRLTESFGTVGADVVESVVHDAAEHLRGVPVVDFVPLLVERRSREVLRALARRPRDC